MAVTCVRRLTYVYCILEKIVIPSIVMSELFIYPTHVLRGNTTTITAVWWAVAYALFCWRGARDKYGSRAGGT